MLKTEQLQPKELLGHELGLREGLVYADLGIGSSAAFIIEAAKLVGEDGIVYGVDILQNVIEASRSRIDQLGLMNIRLVWSDLEVYGAAKAIHNDVLDAVSLINLLYMTRQDEHVFNEANRMLKPGGKALVIDWSETEKGSGPPMEERTSLDKVRQMAKVVGWKELRVLDLGRYHFGVVFQK